MSNPKAAVLDAKGNVEGFVVPAEFLVAYSVHADEQGVKQAELRHLCQIHKVSASDLVSVDGFAAALTATRKAGV